MHWSESEYQNYLLRRAGDHPPAVPGAAARSPLPEKALLATIRRLATHAGWLVYHTYDSRRSEEGFPDLVLVRPGRLVFAELKSATGKLTQDQIVWLNLLTHSVDGVACYVWRPGDLPDIENLLR